MAGKKGMRHARPRNEAERDMHALIKIEQLYDALVFKHMLKCETCRAEIPLKDLPPQVVSMLNKRYDKLKATKTEATVTHKSSWGDALDHVQRVESEMRRSNNASEAPQHAGDSDETRVTH